ncbi:hypothetical protein BJ742DRAFT_745447 [Cladochytrium replicatum]|nr:hypothetical protein BJ742DRAFT_745447 [Cladochytrium replicatum]
MHTTLVSVTHVCGSSGWSNPIAVYQQEMAALLDGRSDEIEIYLGPREKDELESEVGGVRRFVYEQIMGVVKVNRDKVTVYGTGGDGDGIFVLVGEDEAIPFQSKGSYDWSEEFSGVKGKILKVHTKLEREAEPLRRLQRKGRSVEWSGDRSSSSAQWSGVVTGVAAAPVEWSGDRSSSSTRWSGVVTGVVAALGGVVIGVVAALSGVVTGV